MPKTYNDVRDEYQSYKQQFPDGPLDLSSFAKQMDTLDGAQERSSAYHDSWYKQADAAVDRGFQATHLPELTGAAGEYLGKGFDSLVGTNVAPTVKQVGEDVPRMIAEGLLTVPEVGSGAGIPAAALTWANRARKIAGYGSAALRGGAQTDSALGAGISAASLGLGNKLIPAAEHAVAEPVRKWLEGGVTNLAEGALPQASTAAERILPHLAGVVGGAVPAATALNEATRQAEMSVGPNAVPLSSPERNPLTPENIAGNVAGAAFFVPQILTAMTGGPRLSPKQSRQMYERDVIAKEKASMATGATTQTEFPLTEDVPTAIAEDHARSQVLHDIIRSNLEASRVAEKDGDAPRAQKLYDSALDSYNELISRGGTNLTDEMKTQLATTIDEGARMAPAETPEGFDRFVSEVGHYINGLWQGQTAFENEKLTREDHLNWADKKQVADHEKWLADEAKKVGTQRHPDARAFEVVKQMWSVKDASGKPVLDPLTPEWLAANWQKTFNQSGNVDFTNRVVQQQVANYYADHLQAALEYAKANVKAVVTETEQPKGVREVSERDRAWAAALNDTNVPLQARREIMNRTLEIFKHGNFNPWEAEHLGVREGTWRHPKRPAEIVTAITPWQRAVITAMKTYDPETNTVALPIRKQGMQRVGIDTLWRKQGNRYVWDAGSTTLAKAEGGKQSLKETTNHSFKTEEEARQFAKQNSISGKFVTQRGDQWNVEQKRPNFESNIQDILTTEHQDALGASTDEEEAKTNIGRGGEPGLLEQGFSDAVTPNTLPVNPDEALGLVDEPVEPTGKVKAKLAAGVKKVTANIDALTDEQLWTLAKDQLRVKSETFTTKPQRLRLALKAALLDVEKKSTDTPSAEGLAFLAAERERGAKFASGRATEMQQVHEALRSFFQATAPMPGGSGKVEFHKERLQNIFRRLADDGTVAKVKSGETGPKAAMPAVGGSDVTPTEGLHPHDVLENPPQPGDFVRDVERTVRTWADRNLSQRGYAGTVKDFYVNIAVALARQLNTENVDFYRVLDKELGWAWKDDANRGIVGVNVDQPVPKGQELKYAQQILQVLSHEMTHIDGYIRSGLIPKPDGYSDERGRLLDGMYRMFTGLTEPERAAMLQEIQSALPVELQTNLRQPDGRPYGTTNADEFVAQMNSMTTKVLINSSVAGRQAMKDVLDFGPTEVRDLARNTFKTIEDVLESMRAAAKAGDVKDPFVLTKGFEALVESALAMSELRHADLALADAQNAISNLTPGGLMTGNGFTDAVWRTPTREEVEGVAAMPREVSESAKGALAAVQAVLSPRAAKAPDAKQNLVQHFLAPFRNQMWGLERQGIKVARPISDTTFQHQSGSHRIFSNIVSAFMKKNPDGTITLNQDAPLVKDIATDPNGRWRTGVNEVSAWQQGEQALKNGKKMQAQSMFVTDKNGQIIVNPDLKDGQAAWDKIRKGMSPDEQARVMNHSIVLDRTSQVAAQYLLQGQIEHNQNILAKSLQAWNRSMPSDQALILSKKVHDAFMSGQPQAIAGLLPPEQLKSVQRLLVGDITPEHPAGDGLVGILSDLEAKLSNRPGFRSESLPHDWIIRYRNAAGELKFDSRPHEKQALVRADEIKASGGRIDGEIINRNDPRQLTDFEDPDRILGKLVEQEGYVWDKFVNEMQKQYGQSLGDALREGYTPASQALKAQNVKDVNKYLTERKGYVDRDAFDYIDGTMTYAARLSNALASRTVRGQNGVWLNDPSVRQNVAFQNLVNGHMDEMFRPQSQVAKDMRVVIAGNFLWGNLGSALVNGTQTATTTVPIFQLMSKSGSTVGAWKTVIQAVKDMTNFKLTKDWQNVASGTKGVDPKSWTLEQSMAELFRQHRENGGISQTVTDDILIGQDQKTLLNTKFGRGDYGPVPRTAMIRDGMYLASTVGMFPFRLMENMNAQIAFLGGIRLGYEKGLRGQALYDEAAHIQGLSTFGGGRANSSGLQDALSKGFSPGSAAVAMTLQQYSFGLVSMHAQMVKDMLGNSKGLTPVERRQAIRAYGSMLMTQVAISGVLGLPLVGAALTALEKVFGIPANQAVRNGLAELGRSDEEDTTGSGATFAEVGTNGFLDHFLGVDVSSRLGISSLLGTSSYRGFSWGDLAGPTGSMLENGVKALGYFGQQMPMEGLQQIVPNALKNVVAQGSNQAKYGDSGIRDAAGNLTYQPTQSEAVGYALGFRPSVLSRRRQLQSAVATAKVQTTAVRDRELDRAAQNLLQGNPEPARRYANDLAVSTYPHTDPLDLLRAVMDRAVAATTPKDALADGQAYNESQRLQIARTFGADANPRRSEVEVQRTRMGLARVLGDPRLMPTPESVTQARLVDQLVESRGMTRSQAVRLVSLFGL